MSPWGWRPERTEGIWRHGAPCLKPIISAAPWITVVLLLVMLWIVGGSLVAAKGVVVDLPGPGLADGESTGPVALVMPVKHETLVFFDDARYLLGDGASAAAFAEHLSASLAKSGRKTLLALADRRVACGDLMRFAELARQGGVTRVLFAEKKAETEE